VTSDIWSVTSYSELRLDAQDAQRWEIGLHPTEERRQAYACQLMKDKVGACGCCFRLYQASSRTDRHLPG